MYNAWISIVTNITCLIFYPPPFSGVQLFKGSGGDEACNQTRIYCITAKVCLSQLIKNLSQHFYAVTETLNFHSCRKSSGFSRGASIYRGVTRFGVQNLKLYITRTYWCVGFCFNTCSCMNPADIINRVGGKQELAA